MRTCWTRELLVGLGLVHADVVEDLVKFNIPVNVPVSVSAGHLFRHHTVAKPEYYQDLELSNSLTVVTDKTKTGPVF